MKQSFFNNGGFGSALYAAAMVLGTGYFLYFAFEGEYGKFRQMQIVAQHKTLQKELQVAQAERAVVENRVKRLSDDYMDLDLLDERARKVLGLMRADEIVIQ